jgi:uncharacterized protein (TIGR03435 family)
VMMRSSGDKLELYGERVTMRQLIVSLTDFTDRPIVDQTGLTETYAISMSWVPQSTRTPNDIDTGLSDAPVGDTVYSALEKYLGLRLVPSKKPVEMLIIDRLERVPTEN